MPSRRLRARGLAVVLAVGLLAACNPDPGTGPTSSPTAESPSVSPSATPSPTPTENAQEREQREAFEAAEKAYRANFAESGRLSMAGGADKPTKTLLATSMGQYLKSSMQSLQGIKKEGLRSSGPGDIVRLQRGAFGPDKLVLRACEDYRGAVLKAKNGDVYTPEGTRVYDQTITVTRVKDAWKLSDQDSTEVKAC